MPAEDPFKIQKLLNDIRTFKRKVPTLLANQAQTYFVKSFDTSGLDGEPKWKEVKRRMQGTNEYKYPKLKGLTRRTKPILTMTGTLRRRVNNSIKVATWPKIELLVDLPYAKAQNEGNSKIDARPFMKQTNKLAKMQSELIEKNMNKIFKWQA